MRRVRRVQALTGYQLAVTFDDGVAGTVDLSDLAGHGVFACWSDHQAFEQVRIGLSGDIPLLQLRAIAEVLGSMTFGFPLDLSQELAREKSLSVDEPGFARELEDQKQRARQSWKGEAKRKEMQVYEGFRGLQVRSRVHEPCELAEVRVAGLLKDGRRTEVLAGGESGEVILVETTFYGEAAGQVGDTGTLKGPRVSALVENVYFATPELIVHAAKVLSGEVRVGDRIDAVPDLSRRQAISNNHTGRRWAAGCSR